MNFETETPVDEGKERLIATAEALFKKYGIRSVSVDDIAKELSMSKRTLYQHFQTKDDLVMAVVTVVMKTHQCNMDKIKPLALNAVHHLYLITNYFKSVVSGINPVLFYDMQKFYPTAWDIYRSHKEHVIHCDMINVLKTGVEQGLFWPDMNYEIIGTMRAFQIEMAFDNAIFPQQKFDLLEVQMQLFHHFIRGICTPKGIELYQNYQNHPI